MLRPWEGAVVVRSDEQGPPVDPTDSAEDHARRRLEEEMNSRFGDTRGSESPDAEPPDADVPDVNEMATHPHEDD